MINFHWGHLTARYPDQPQCQIYAIGDVIRWRRGPDGQIPVDTSFSDDDTVNGGDPGIPHLIITDYGTDCVCIPQECTHCHVEVSAAFEIVDNIIVRAWAHTLDELIPGHAPQYRRFVLESREWVVVVPPEAERHEVVTDYIVNADGSLTPRPGPD